MRQIRLCGLGGQGIQIIGEILAKASFLDKKFVALSTSFGAQVRGGITKADLILSDQIIDFPLVVELDYLVAMLQEAYEQSLPLLKKDGIIVGDSGLVTPLNGSPFQYIPIGATKKALQELKNEMAANIILLTAANAIGSFVSSGSLEKSIRTVMPPHLIEANLKAMEIGLDMSREFRLT